MYEDIPKRQLMKCPLTIRTETEGNYTNYAN